ncbi:MAG TPA: hypothetical protein VFV08_02155 [Puia sp.]|nr:hypothetical protein [Puia sp.]
MDQGSVIPSLSRRNPSFLQRGTLTLLFVLLIVFFYFQNSFAQGNKNEPKPPKRISEYQGKGSGNYVEELRRADIDFDNSDYPACTSVYIKYVDSLDKEQHNRLGWLYYLGLGVDKSLSGAKKQFEIAAHENVAQAYYYLGGIIFKESQAQNNMVLEAEAIKNFQHAADLGDAEAMNALGLELEQTGVEMHLIGSELKDNNAKAAEWYAKAAQLGSSNGMVNLGDCYVSGLGIKKNKDSAMKWYFESAKLGNSVAMYNIGNGYNFGQSPFRKNYDSALKWYRLATDNGYAYAMTNMGYMYEKGHGVPVDYNQAMNLYKKAAEAGDPYGANNLGRMYNFGIGVEKNVDSAMAWYAKGKTLKTYVLDKNK